MSSVHVCAHVTLRNFTTRERYIHLFTHFFFYHKCDVCKTKPDKRDKTRWNIAMSICIIVNWSYPFNTIFIYNTLLSSAKCVSFIHSRYFPFICSVSTASHSIVRINKHFLFLVNIFSPIWSYKTSACTKRVLIA